MGRYNTRQTAFPQQPVRGFLMSVYDTFSKREEKKRKQGQADVFQYDTLPVPFRAQVVHIWNDVLGHSHTPSSEARSWWIAIHGVMLREKGVFALSPLHDAGPEVECKDLLLHGSTADAVDLIELSFR